MSPALIDGNRLHQNRLDRDMYMLNAAEAPRRMGIVLDSGPLHRRVMRQYKIAHRWTEGDGCQRKACGQGNSTSPVDNRRGKSSRGLAQSAVHTLLHTGGRLDASQVAQYFIDLCMDAHCKLPSCSSSAASAWRARYSRERMVDSVVFSTRAISTVESSCTAERSKVSRSLAGSVSIRRRIVA
jgi:hypothetical protein